MLKVLSLGAGVQSSTLALMCEKNLIPPPDLAIFADTGDEPKSVYEWLDFLITQLSFPVIITKHQSNLPLSEYEGIVMKSQKSGKTYVKSMIPAFTKSSTGRGGMLPRKCTRDFKIRPIQQAIKRHLGEKYFHGNKLWVEQYIGISVDEAHRMKTSSTKQIVNVYPLVDRHISRQDCLQWMKSNNYPEPPRSACTFCPYHSDKEWHRLKTQEPEAFAAAVSHEKKLQASFEICEASKHMPYLHESRTPLEEVEFDPSDTRNPFGNECEGMCGI